MSNMFDLLSAFFGLFHEQRSSISYCHPRCYQTWLDTSHWKKNSFRSLGCRLYLLCFQIWRYQFWKTKNWCTVLVELNSHQFSKCFWIFWNIFLTVWSPVNTCFHSRHPKNTIFTPFYFTFRLPRRTTFSIEPHTFQSQFKNVEKHSAGSKLLVMFFS
jgi:hypothetical protein